MSVKFLKPCIKVSTVLSFLLFFQSAFAQYDFSSVDKKLDSYKKELGGNIVALIYKNNKVIYDKKLGDFDKKTVAPIASCSKWLTAAMVMTLVDEGKISLDDKVSKYLPIFAKYGKGYITIRHCLSHQTGIEQERTNLIGILQRRKYASLEEEVNDLASKKEIEYNPGTGFHYGSAGLNIAARVCEVVTRKSFNQLMIEKIFRPLGMRSTTFQNENYSLAPNPSGGARSNAEEYMNFLVMILNKGVFNGKRILSENAIAEMQKEENTLDMVKYTPKAGEGYTYGLGEWIMEKDAGGKATVVASPGLFGTWPMVDNCRGYACIFFVKTLLGSEQKRNIYIDLKKEIDDQIPSNCK
ncbi:MAG: beta-lactamase family protein [Bacteroidota bacterium]|nr:beta-lactamase family protein [Bacteroidota bacterium]